MAVMCNLARAFCSLGTVLVIAGCARPEPRGPCTMDGTLGTICGFENPEDLEFVPAANVILVTNMRFDGRDHDGIIRGGFVSAVVPGGTDVHKVWPTEAVTDEADPDLGDPICRTPPGHGTFYPHGLTSVTRGARTVAYVIAHQGESGGREAVELFEVKGQGEAVYLSWVGCIPLAPRTTGNDIAVAPDGEVIVSNYQPSASLWHTIKANAFGMVTGDIQAWTRERGWRTLPRTKASQPNGVAISPDGSTIFYSETGTGRVYRVSRRGSGMRASVDVGGHPDGLAWSGRGTLLSDTHTGGPALLYCLFGRSPCRTSWEVHEIEPATMSATLYLAHDGDTVGAASAPLVAGDHLYLGSIYDDRIGVAPLPSR